MVERTVKQTAVMLDGDLWLAWNSRARTGPRRIVLSVLLNNALADALEKRGIRVERGSYKRQMENDSLGP